jgi:hypothetical protein
MVNLTPARRAIAHARIAVFKVKKEDRMINDTAALLSRGPRRRHH